MISHSPLRHPVSTGLYLHRILLSVLLLFCVVLILQLPLIFTETPIHHYKLGIWLGYFTVMMWLLWKRKHLTRTWPKTGLFLLYFSYLLFAIQLWPDITNTHYFLLLALVVAGFLYTQHERAHQHLMVLIAIVLYLFAAIVLYLNVSRYALIQFCNDLTLVLICSVIYFSFQSYTLSRWKNLKAAHLGSYTLLSRLLPNAPDNSADLWPIGEVRRVPCATVLFADLGGFTQINRQSGDDKTLSIIQAVMPRIDRIAEQHSVEKIKTNGDQYIATSSIHATDHKMNCKNVMSFALALQHLISKYASRSQQNVTVRVGIATGPINAGIIGNQRPQFDIWGQTVNLAAYLEQTCNPQVIRCCQRTAELLGSDYVGRITPLHSTKHPHIHCCHDY